MKTYCLLLFAVIWLFASSCEEDPFDDDRRVTGSGRVVTQPVELNEFSVIDLEGVANIYIETGTTQSVSITAYANIIEFIDFRVVGDELLIGIREDKKLNSDEEIRIDITLPEIDAITLSGVGNFNLSGQAQHSLDIELNGVGNVDAYGLPLYEARIEINGTGNVSVKAKDRIYVDIDGLGNVYYLGDPQLDIDISGLGDVVSGN